MKIPKIDCNHTFCYCCNKKIGDAPIYGEDKKGFYHFKCKYPNIMGDENAGKTESNPV